MFVKVVPQGHCLIVERFGRPTRVAYAGLNFFLPFLDTPKNVARIGWHEESNKEGIFIALTEQIFDTKEREYITKDNVTVGVNCVFNWRIVDPIKAVYEVNYLHRTLKEAVLNQIRSFIGAHELNYLLSSRAEVSESIVANLADTMNKWGINLIKAEIQDLRIDEATRDAMRQEMEALRRGRAAKLESEGQAEAAVKAAEAQKRSQILKAEGEKASMMLLAQADKGYIDVLASSVGTEQAAKILIAQKTLQTYSNISGNDANKVFLPPPAAASLLMLDKDQKTKE